MIVRAHSKNAGLWITGQKYRYYRFDSLLGAERIVFFFICFELSLALYPFTHPQEISLCSHLGHLSI
jgi:hypothetical protein